MYDIRDAGIQRILMCGLRLSQPLFVEEQAALGAVEPPLVVGLLVKGGATADQVSLVSWLIGTRHSLDAHFSLPN